MSINLKQGLRKRSELANIETTTIADMMKVVEADEFELVENAEGVKFLHLLNTENEEYFSIKVGKKVKSTAKGEKLVSDLIQNYTVYCGESDPDKYSGNMWFTFGPEPSGNEPIVKVSAAKIMKGLQRANAAQ